MPEREFMSKLRRAVTALTSSQKKRELEKRVYDQHLGVGWESMPEIDPNKLEQAELEKGLTMIGLIRSVLDDMEKQLQREKSEMKRRSSLRSLAEAERNRQTIVEEEKLTLLTQDEERKFNKEFGEKAMKELREMLRGIGQEWKKSGSKGFLGIGAERGFGIDESYQDRGCLVLSLTGFKESGQVWVSWWTQGKKGLYNLGKPNWVREAGVDYLNYVDVEASFTAIEELRAKIYQHWAEGKVIKTTHR